MDISLLEQNVRSKQYGSTDAFMADAKWIQHNCIVYNTGNCNVHFFFFNFTFLVQEITIYAHP